MSRFSHEQLGAPERLLGDLGEWKYQEEGSWSAQLHERCFSRVSSQSLDQVEPGSRRRKWLKVTSDRSDFNSEIFLQSGVSVGSSFPLIPEAIGVTAKEA